MDWNGHKTKEKNTKWETKLSGARNNDSRNVTRNKFNEINDNFPMEEKKKKISSNYATFDQMQDFFSLD